MKSTCLNILFLAAAANAQRVVQASIQHFESKELGPAVPLINLGLGTPAQNITGIFDTACSDIIVPEAAPFKPDAVAGLQLLAGESFNATLSRGEHFEGDYAKTTVTLDGVEVPDAQVGFASNIQTQANISDLAVVGVGLVAREATVNKYNNLPRILNVSGVTNSQAYSVVLNATPLGNGSVFFGGIDRSKFTGDLQQVPLVKDKAGQFSEFLVELSSIALVPAAAPAKVRRSTRQERREQIRRMPWHKKRQGFSFDGGEESSGFGPGDQSFGPGPGPGDQLFGPGSGGLSNQIQDPIQGGTFEDPTGGFDNGFQNGNQGIPGVPSNNPTDSKEPGNNQGIIDGNNQGIIDGNNQGVTDGNNPVNNDGGKKKGITDGITDGNNQGVTDGNNPVNNDGGKKKGITDGITDGNNQGITDGNNQGVTDGNNPVSNDGDKNKEPLNQEDPSNSPVNNNDGKKNELPNQKAPTETRKQGAPKTTSKQAAPKETPKQEAPKLEAPKLEAPKTTSKLAAPKTTSTQAAPKTTSSKQAAPKETPKQEAPKKEAPKKDNGGGQPAKLIASTDLGLDQRSAVTLMNTAGGAMALPAAVVAKMAGALGTSFSATNGLGPVDCGRLGGDAALLMRFRNNTVEARVPLANLRVSAELADPAIAQRGLCEVAIRPVPDGGAEPNVATLPFFAAMYTVFDLGNRSLWFAQASGDPSVPGAQLEEFP
ncbi:putative aspartic-type endopeptidase OPSB [Beauveria bassiana D1-5]|uniref:Putative aspartic-type endopeptidase OPSB n=1 Tax=Beauveria bassiana D1-5 TaxID=1245745 RepID=A0A0A2VGZ7_BEABA|nr:putative aspartic-type endopeptidase OPSB [Beauveria bassiana D1-5]